MTLRSSSRLSEALLGIVIWVCLANCGISSDATSDEEKLHIGLQELPAVMALPSKANGDSRFDRACIALEKRLNLPGGLLRDHLRDFAEKLIKSGDTPTLERAAALFSLGRYSEGEAQALAIGNDVKAVELAGRCAAQLGEYDRALEHYHAATEQIDEQHDPMQWASIQRDIAIILMATGKFGEAETLWRRILEIHLAHLPPQHPDIIGARNVLANVLVKEGKYSDAASQYEQVVSILEKSRGPENAETLRAKQNLERALKASK
jgi:tetratricopeptide (TPR) repeat protein